MKLINTILFLVFCLFANAQNLVSKDGDKHIRIKNSSYELVVNKNPIGIELLKGNLVISSLSGSNGFSYSNENGANHLVAINDWQKQGKTLFLKAESDQTEMLSEIVIVMKNDKVEVSWTLPEMENVESMKLAFDLIDGNHWYGGHVNGGHNWPLETAQVSFEPFLAHSNQGTPFWLTSAGVGYFMPCYHPMGFTINNEDNGRFEVSVKETRKVSMELLIEENAPKVYRSFAKEIGLPKVVPPKGFFDKPTFNTWIEYMKDLDQQKIMDYAHDIRENDFPCDVLMIDAGWSPIHGEYEFIEERFPDPKAMIDELHEMGFKVMLWISPYVREGSKDFEFLVSNDYLIRDETGTKPGHIKWWGGNDYELDMSNPEAFDWFLEKLRKLQQKYGVDGFKQDGGDAKYIPENYQTFADVSSNGSTDYWAKLGDYFEYNEYRVSWMAQSSGLVQRLRDKHNNWTRESGLGSLIPDGLTNSLIGYPYFCPDMIGGGDAKDFRDPNYKGMGTELFIRWTEASALMPMMQFSYSPWHLEKKTVGICRKYAKLHEDLGDYIYEFALQAATTGDPIARPLFYDNPEDEEAYLISDEFILGDRILVAPVLEEGAIDRNIYLPKGLWKDYWSDKTYQGGRTLEDYPAPIDVLPLFIKLN
ncbi:glycoside hydrolase family 31 protein [uncultured Draconibacterium sp.]|uniref:glycoside hydrolase family 31 protein n=1 Tax=uncultured Draconibacterium sp. TaxID=1573823 RepID=UPI0029C96181|nr:glycoside hydrolase family 31 protein [uncultured Draconibacterium sp.]